MMDRHKQQALAEVERIARDVASNLGLEIVEFIFRSQGSHSLLRIDVDRSGMPGVGLADCERFSRTLEDRIENLTFFETSYELQVSSPGIDRPIRTDDDLRRNDGRPIWMEFRDANGTIRELRGTLSGPHEPGTVSIVTDARAVSVSRDAIVLMKQDVTLGARRRKDR
jgi:ribosome maturation factor RimP